MLLFWSNNLLPKFLPDLATQQVPPQQATEKLQQLLDCSCSKFFSPYRSFANSLIFFFQHQSGSNTPKQKSKDAAEEKTDLIQDPIHALIYTWSTPIVEQASSSPATLPPLLDRNKAAHTTNVYTHFICIQPNVVCGLVFFPLTQI